MIPFICSFILLLPSASADEGLPPEVERLSKQYEAAKRTGKLEDAYLAFKQIWEASLLITDESLDLEMLKGNTQSQLAQLAASTGRLDASIAHYRLAVKHVRNGTDSEKYPFGHPGVVSLQRGLGRSLIRAERQGEAVKVLRTAVAECRRLKKHEIDMPVELLPTVLNSLANAQLKLPDLLHESIEVNREAMQILEELPQSTQNQLGIAQCKTSIAKAEMNLGRYADARKLFESSLKTKNRLLGKRQRDAITLSVAHNDIAIICQKQADYDGAKKSFESAVELLKKSYNNKPHPNIVVALCNLAGAYQSLGEDAKSSATLSNAHKIIIQLEQIAPKSTTPLWATYYRILGQHYRSIGSFEESIEAAKQAVQKETRLASTRGSQFALMFAKSQLATSYDEAKQYQSAADLGEETLAIAQQLYPKSKFANGHPALVRHQANLAASLISIGKTAETEQAAVHLQAAMAMAKDVFPKSVHPLGNSDFQLLFRERARLARQQGRAAEEFELLLKEADMATSLAELTLDGLSEAESRSFIRSAKLRSPGQLLSTLSETSSEPNIIQAWDHWIKRRLLSYRFPEIRRAASLKAGDEQWSQYLEDRKFLSRQLRLAFENPEQANLSEIERLQKKKEEFEQTAAFDSANAIIARNDVDALSIQQQIPAECVLLDFVEYSRMIKKRTDSKPWYGVFVVSNQAINFLPLAPTSDVVDAIRQSQAEIQSLGSDLTALKRLSRLIWQPINQRVPSVTRTLAILPAGELDAVPWTAMSEPKQLLSRFEIKQLADLHAISSAPQQLPKRILHVGQLDYSGDGNPYPQLPASSPSAELRSFSGLRFDQLSGDVRADQLISRTQKFDGLHLATHSLTFHKQQRSRTPKNFEDILLRNPLQGAGFALGSANTSEEGSLVHGEFIAAQNLQQLKLVVLAMCHAENITRIPSAGLQHAFHRAGVHTVVANAWQADDTATQLLLTEFYREIDAGSDAVAALQAAQRKMKSGQLSPDLRHPFYWAGWTVSQSRL